eukprot:RCo024102
MINVQVKFCDTPGSPSNAVHCVPVASTDTVLTLKTAVFQRTGVSPEMQRLLSKGRLLNDSSTLESNKLADNELVILVRRIVPNLPSANRPVSGSGLTPEAMQKAIQDIFAGRAAVPAWPTAPPTRV